MATSLKKLVAHSRDVRMLLAIFAAAFLLIGTFFILASSSNPRNQNVKTSNQDSASIAPADNLVEQPQVSQPAIEQNSNSIQLKQNQSTVVGGQKTGSNTSSSSAVIDGQTFSVSGNQTINKTIDTKNGSAQIYLRSATSGNENSSSNSSVILNNNSHTEVNQ